MKNIDLKSILENYQKELRDIKDSGVLGHEQLVALLQACFLLPKYLKLANESVITRILKR